jgi:hypothetical protein
VNTFLGCDPDIHTLSLASVSEDLKDLRVYMARYSVGKGLDAAAKVLKSFSDMLDAAFETPDWSLQFHKLAIVEAPDHTYVGRTTRAKPQDLAMTSLAAGGAAGLLCTFVPVKFMLPREWKGQVPKEIHQKRTLDKLGIEYDMMGKRDPYPVPRDYEQYVKYGSIRPCDWRDVNDSVGLALVARDRWLLENKRRVK